MNNISLEEITKVLLNTESDHKELYDISRELSSFFDRYSKISTATSHFEAKDDGKHTFLESGVAISPLDAAICTHEYLRTAKYMRGVYSAINDLLEKFQNEKVHILYAGTGPYATLVIPILHLFSTERLQVTFLDIHQTSLDSVKNIIKELSLEKFVKEYVCTDATTYAVKEKTHLMVTETMRANFEGEPQVHITLNLLPQLCEGGVFIPECVNIYLETSEGKRLSEIIKLDSTKKWNRENLLLSPKVIINDNLKENESLLLWTKIDVYKEHILEKNQCSLNLPMPLFLEESVAKGDTLEFIYEFNNKPEILCTHYQQDNKKQLDNFYPESIDYKYKDSRVAWKQVNSDSFNKKTFAEELRGKKHFTSWESFFEESSSMEFVEPKGFIFHTSRSGSSLLSNALNVLDKNIVIKEANITHDILSQDLHKDIDKQEIQKRLKAAIQLLGRKRVARAENLFIQFNCYEIGYLEVIKEIYPDVPVVILYNNPEEVIQSQAKSPDMFVLPYLVKTKLFQSIQQNLAIDEYREKVFESIFAEITQQKDALLINFLDLEESLFSKVFPYFGLTLTDEEKEKIQNTLQPISKKNNPLEEQLQENIKPLSNILIDSFKILEGNR